jgi:hypothetical protein
MSDCVSRINLSRIEAQTEVYATWEQARLIFRAVEVILGGVRYLCLFSDD